MEQRINNIQNRPYQKSNNCNKGKDNPFHFCYNPYKKQFLEERGLEYAFKDTHRLTERDFWAYLKCNELDELLKEWRIVQQERFKE